MIICQWMSEFARDISPSFDANIKTFPTLSVSLFSAKHSSKLLDRELTLSRYANLLFARGDSYFHERCSNVAEFPYSVPFQVSKYTYTVSMREYRATSAEKSCHSCATVTLLPVPPFIDFRQSSQVRLDSGALLTLIYSGPFTLSKGIFSGRSLSCISGAEASIFVYISYSR